MNKNAIIVIFVIILIIALAVFAGINLGKVNSQQTNTTPTSEPTTKSTESPIPTEEPTELPESPEPTQPTEEPTVSPEPSVDVSKMNADEKKEYAKSIAKQTWEKLGIDTQVYYSYDDIDSNGDYLITVREEATTKELVRYKININTNTCEITY